MSRRSKPTLYVRGLPDGTRPEDLRRIFVKYGSVADVTVPLDYYTRRQQGYAFVEFEDYRDAEDAVKGLDRTRFQGRDIQIEFGRGFRKTPSEMRSRYGKSTSSASHGDRAGHSRDGDRDRRGRDRDRDRSRDKPRERDRNRDRSQERDRDRDRARDRSLDHDCERERYKSNERERDRPNGRKRDRSNERKSSHRSHSPSEVGKDKKEVTVSSRRSGHDDRERNGSED